MSEKSRIGLFFDEVMLRHDAGTGHPERPERLRAIVDELRRAPMERATWIRPQPARREWIERVHDPRYVERIDSLRGETARLDEDTAVSPGSIDSAYLAAGAATDSVDAVINRAIGSAFALVRPPGHHAERDRAMGFCLFNNIAIAAEHAVAAHGLERVLVVDWDVHHGNGTQHIFEERCDVLVFNTHQWPLWPGVGALDEVGCGEGEGFTVNCPLPAGTDDAGYLAVFNRVLAPIAEAFKPQLVLVSAGFDAHRDDPLGGMRVTAEGFAALTASVCEIAARHADNRVALMLEGGYDLAALSRSVRRCVEVLADAPARAIEAPDRKALGVIDQLCRAHRRYWPV